MAIINGQGRVGVRVTSGGGAPSYDADAQAFFTAASLTDSTQMSAINQFVLDLKSNSLWSLGKYMYLGFLGSASKVKYNLFNPSAYQLTISSGWNYDNQGMQGNGSSAYARTGFIPSGNTDKNSQSIGVYSQTDVDEFAISIGSLDASTSVREYMIIKTSAYANIQLAAKGNYTSTGGVNDSRGFFLISRNSSSSFKMYKRASTILTNTTPETTYDLGIEDYLNALNYSGTPLYYSGRKISLYFRFTGLNDTQSTNLNTCINTLLTSLSIPIW
jgi:hypothetical protein